MFGGCHSSEAVKFHMLLCGYSVLLPKYSPVRLSYFQRRLHINFAEDPDEGRCQAESQSNDNTKACNFWKYVGVDQEDTWHDGCRSGVFIMRGLCMHERISEFGMDAQRQFVEP